MLSSYIYLQQLNQHVPIETEKPLDVCINYLKQIKHLYTQYINNSKYVFSSHTNNTNSFIIILKKIQNTITNEIRSDVSNQYFALFKGHSFYVELILNKFDPSVIVNQIKETAIFIKDHTISSDVCDISYYKSIDPAFYSGIHNFSSSYNITKCKFWNENGSLKETYQLKYGAVSGKKKIYNDGKLIECSNYFHGKRNGMSIHYYENSSIKSIYMYVNGYLNGLQTTFYANDKMKSEYKYSIGKKNGICKDYYDNGELKLIENYIDDKLINFRKRWYANTKLEYDEYYDENGYDHGIWKTYYESGQLKHEKIYEHGKKIGIWKCYHSNGELHMKLDYDKGLRELYTSMNKSDIYF
jgi:antitoxin component YwqK of YwqJK toxin-antitoxin module